MISLFLMLVRYYSSRSRGLVKSWKDAARPIILDHPSAIQADGMWYDVFLCSLHDEEFWPRLERFIRALKTGDKYFMLIQPILSSGQHLTLGQSTIITQDLDMNMLTNYYTNLIAVLEERYHDTFTGQTRIVLKNISGANIRETRRSFSTTRVTPQSGLGFDTLQSGINSMQSTMSTMEQNMQTGFNAMVQSMQSLPSALATAMGAKPAASQTAPTLFSNPQVASSPAVSTPSRVALPASTVSAPGSYYVTREIWAQLNNDVRAALISARQGSTFNGNTANLFVTREIWMQLPANVRNLLMSLRGQTPRSSRSSTARTTYTASAAPAQSQSNVVNEIKTLLAQGLGPVFSKYG